MATAATEISTIVDISGLNEIYEISIHLSTLDNKEQIKELHIKNCTLRKMHCEMIANFLTNNSTLETLTLDNNNYMWPDALLVIHSSINAQTTGLTTLNIGWTDIVNLTYMAKIISKFTRLQNLSLDYLRGTSVLYESIATHSNLSHLRITRCELNQQTKLLQMMLQTGNLRSLILENNHCAETSLTTLTHNILQLLQLRRNMQHIAIYESFPDISDTCAALFELDQIGLLKQNPYLETLIISLGNTRPLPCNFLTTMIEIVRNHYCLETFLTPIIPQDKYQQCILPLLERNHILNQPQFMHYTLETLNNFSGSFENQLKISTIIHEVSALCYNIPLPDNHYLKDLLYLLQIFPYKYHDLATSVSSAEINFIRNIATHEFHHLPILLMVNKHVMDILINNRNYFIQNFDNQTAMALVTWMVALGQDNPVTAVLTQHWYHQLQQMADIPPENRILAMPNLFETQFLQQQRPVNISNEEINAAQQRVCAAMIVMLKPPRENADGNACDNLDQYGLNF